MFLYIRGFDYTKTAAAMLPDQPAPAAPDDNMQREIDGLIRSANLNLSFCYLKLNEPDKAKKFATAVTLARRVRSSPLTLGVIRF